MWRYIPACHPYGCHPSPRGRTRDYAYTGVLTQLEIESQARYNSQPWRGLSRRTRANLRGRRLKLRRANPIWQQSVLTITILHKGLKQAIAQHLDDVANSVGTTLTADDTTHAHEVPALGDIQGPGPTSSTSLQPAPVATGPPLPAIGDVPMPASPQDCPPQATGVSSSTSSPPTPASPPPAPTAASPNPHDILDMAKAYYALGPTDVDVGTLSAHTAIRSKPIIRKCPRVVKQKFSCKPLPPPTRPATATFPAFSWGPYHIYHGEQRAAYRVMDTRIGRNTKLFKHCGGLLEHMIGN